MRIHGHVTFSRHRVDDVVEEVADLVLLPQGEGDVRHPTTELNGDGLTNLAIGTPCPLGGLAVVLQGRAHHLTIGRDELVLRVLRRLGVQADVVWHHVRRGVEHLGALQRSDFFQQGLGYSDVIEQASLVLVELIDLGFGPALSFRRTSLLQGLLLICNLLLGEPPLVVHHLPSHNGIVFERFQQKLCKAHVLIPVLLR